jgi:hypothetical protein
MGNTECVADGKAPHKKQINVINKTQFEMILDDS